MLIIRGGGRWLLTVVVCVLSLQAGCSIHPIEMVVVNSKSLQERADIPLIEFGDEQHSEKTYNGIWNDGGQIHWSGEQENRYRVKYHPSYSQNHQMVVEGKLNNGKTYPVVLDTGASQALFVNDIHIIENKPLVHPLKPSSYEPVGWGICHLSELQIGKMTLNNWPCFYRQQHTEVRLFGLPIVKDKAIIAGLPALRRFKYVVFDSVNREVGFSPGETFEPGQLELWRQYPLVIEEGLGGNAFIFVRIPIAGEETELQLDTGSGRGLAISRKLWEQIRCRIQNAKLRKGQDLYPYIGLLNCERATVGSLQVGDRMVRNANISIFPDDSPLMDGCQGLLGMEYFRDTVIVLDFERNRMWVKAPR